MASKQTNTKSTKTVKDSIKQPKQKPCFYSKKKPRLPFPCIRAMKVTKTESIPLIEEDTKSTKTVERFDKLTQKVTMYQKTMFLYQK